MDSKEQLRRWVAGESVHMGNKGSGQCCPDFSCCRPEIRTPVEERERFAARYSESGEPPMDMLMTFLSRMIEREGMGGKVHLAGREPEGGE